MTYMAGWTFVRIFEKKRLLDPFGWDGGFGYINQAGSFAIGPPFRKDQPFRDGIVLRCATPPVADISTTTATGLG